MHADAGTTFREAGLGIEIGGTKLQTAVVDAAGRVIVGGHDRIDPAAGAAGILSVLGGQLDRALDEAGGRGLAVRSAGIGFGGPVDHARGVVSTSFHVAGWRDFPLAAWVAEALEPRLGRLPVALENDSNAAALAEAMVGAGRGCRVVLYSNVGSGIGAGLVIDGALYRGRSGGELELGHIRLRPEGGILEETAAGWALDRRVREAVSADPAGPLAVAAAGGGGPPSARLLAAAVAAGDPVARAILDDAAAAYAHALAHAVQLLNPDVVVLGGGVATIGEPWRAGVAERIEPFLMEPFRPGPPVRLAELGEHVVPVGAALAARARRDAGVR